MKEIDFLSRLEECKERMEYMDEMDGELIKIMEIMGIDYEEHKKKYNHNILSLEDFIYYFICEKIDKRNEYEELKKIHDKLLENVEVREAPSKFSVKEYEEKKMSYEILTEEQLKDLDFEFFFIEDYTQDLLKDRGRLYGGICNHYGIDFGDSKWDYVIHGKEVIKAISADERFISKKFN